MDTDGDGLADGLEVDFFTTSALYADTDGDQFDDGYEATTDNRNPRIADLPIVEIDVGNVDLQLDVRFEESSSEGTTTVDTKSISTTMERSRSSSRERVNSSTLEGFSRLRHRLLRGRLLQRRRDEGQLGLVRHRRRRLQHLRDLDEHDRVGTVHAERLRQLPDQRSASVGRDDDRARGRGRRRWRSR
ncbi:MAG: hypothetical protein U5J97_00250 [Trueperaceae bacterium]|nr:hypothetical protein [Trueperaceae bacterium]